MRWWPGYTGMPSKISCDKSTMRIPMSLLSVCKSVDRVKIDWGDSTRERATKARPIEIRASKSLSLEGIVEKSPLCGKITVIPAKAGIHFMIFPFVFAFDSDSREGAPRPNPERMRRIYAVASVSSPVGREDVQAKGQRQRRKWIPAFAGMTNKTAKPLAGTGPCACPRPSPDRAGTILEKGDH